MRFTITNKLLLSFFILILFMATLGGYSYWVMTKQANLTSTIVSTNFIAVKNATEANLLFQLNNNSLQLYTELTDSQKRSVQKKNFEMRKKRISILLLEIEKLNLTDLERTQLEQVNSNRETFLNLTEQLFSYDGDQQEQKNLLTPINKSVDLLSTNFQKLVSTSNEAIQNKQVTIQKQQDSTILTLISLLFFTIISSILMSIIISRMISKPLNLGKYAANSVAQGDLSINEIKVKNNDEIRDIITSINTMVNNLHHSIAKVSESSNHVAAASQQLMASSEQATASIQHTSKLIEKNTRNTKQQMSLINNVTTSIEEFSASIQQIATNSEQTTATSLKTVEFTNSGSESMMKMVKQMNEIDYAVEKVNETIYSLANRMKEIDSVTLLINDIANQTNLLSLNASIEAARAGEHGLGFNIVAQEVRKLSDETKKSTESISTLIKLIQKEMDLAIHAITTGKNIVSDGLNTSTQTEYTFTLIRTSMNQVLQNVQEVSSSVEEMAHASKTIVAETNMIKDCTLQTYETSYSSSQSMQEQLTIMEEISIASQSLANLAESLNNIVLNFKLKN